MPYSYKVNWDQGPSGNQKAEGSEIVITISPPTLAFAAVVLENYKKVGNKWVGFPILAAQERKSEVDGVLKIRLARKDKVLKGKTYLLRTWAADEETGQANFFSDEFACV